MPVYISLKQTKSLYFIVKVVLVSKFRRLHGNTLCCKLNSWSRVPQQKFVEERVNTD